MAALEIEPADVHHALRAITSARDAASAVRGVGALVTDASLPQHLRSQLPIAWSSSTTSYANGMRSAITAGQSATTVANNISTTLIAVQASQSASPIGLSFVSNRSTTLQSTAACAIEDGPLFARLIDTLSKKDNLEAKRSVVEDFLNEYDRLNLSYGREEFTNVLGSERLALLIQMIAQFRRRKGEYSDTADRLQDTLTTHLRDDMRMGDFEGNVNLLVNVLERISGANFKGDDAAAVRTIIMMDLGTPAELALQRWSSMHGTSAGHVIRHIKKQGATTFTEHMYLAEFDRGYLIQSFAQSTFAGAGAEPLSDTLRREHLTAALSVNSSRFMKMYLRPEDDYSLTSAGNDDLRLVVGSEPELDAATLHNVLSGSADVLRSIPIDQPAIDAKAQLLLVAQAVETISNLIAEDYVSKQSTTVQLLGFIGSTTFSVATAIPGGGVGTIPLDVTFGEVSGSAVEKAESQMRYWQTDLQTKFDSKFVASLMAAEMAVNIHAWVAEVNLNGRCTVHSDFDLKLTADDLRASGLVTGEDGALVVNQDMSHVDLISFGAKVIEGLAPDTDESETLQKAKALLEFGAVYRVSGEFVLK